MYLLVTYFGLFLTVGNVIAQTITTTYVCPDGFKSIGKKCYYFSKQSVMWTDSHFYCQLLNSTVLAFHSYREQNLLKGFVTQENNATLELSERWIDGIYDWQQKKWKWGSTGKYIKSNSFTQQNTGNQYKWSCIALNGAKNNKWVAKKCTEKKPFICETETNVYVEFKLYNKRKRKFNITKCSSGEILEEYEKKRCVKLLGKTENEPQSLRHRNTSKVHKRKRNYDDWICPSHMISLANRCYYFSTNKTSWTDAHFECRKNGSKLAIIRNKFQDHNLRRFLNNFIERHDRWIGGIYDWKTAQWRWAMKGQPLTYKGFDNIVLKKKLPQELAWNTIFMDPKLDNQWNAAKQTEKKRFICQTMAKYVKKMGHKKRKRPDAIVTIVTN